MRENTMRSYLPGSSSMGTRRAFLSMLMATAVALAGCGGGGGGGKASTIVTGTVYDSAKEDLPVQGATVTIGGKSGVTTTTAQASSTNTVGSFRLENVPTGTSTATVKLADGTTQSLAFSPPVTSGSNAALSLYVNIGQIGGRILLPNGTPASGAFVSIAATGDLVQTDTTGNFLVINIPTGDTLVSAVLGTSSASKTVTVTNGLTAIGDLQLVEDPNPNPPGVPSTIVGKVKTSDNTAADAGAGATVFLLRNGVQIEQTISGASDGGYSFYVPVGNYSVQVQKNNYQSATAPAIVTDPNKQIEVDVTLTPR